MALYSGTSIKPEKAHTVAEFISNGSTMYGNKNAYLDFSFVENIDGVTYIAKNIIDNYLYYLKELAIEVQLSSDERDKFAYNPKLLSYKLYGTTMWYWLILKLNDLADVHEFDLSEKRKLYLLRPSVLNQSMASIYRAEQFAIKKFNDTHKNETAKKKVESYR